MRRSRSALLLLLLFLLRTTTGTAQNSRMIASSFAAGAGSGSTPQTVLTTSLGEPLAGSTSSTSTTLGGGFLGGGPPAPAGISLSVQGAWNLISVPLTVPDYAKTVLFPTATSDAFAYQAGYVSQPVLQNGRGYWLKFASAQSVFLAGQMRMVDSITVSPGWNIIGSISQSVPVTSIQSIPPGLVTSSFFGYSTGGYGVAPSIDPGAGYWVKVSATGRLIRIAHHHPADGGTASSTTGRGGIPGGGDARGVRPGPELPEPVQPGNGGQIFRPEHRDEISFARGERTDYRLRKSSAGCV
jgi:hypothetical protein